MQTLQPLALGLQMPVTVHPDLHEVQERTIYAAITNHEAASIDKSLQDFIARVLSHTVSILQYLTLLASIRIHRSKQSQ